MLRPLVLALACCALAQGRPTVRNVKTGSEWRKLLAHHAEVTGLPVIVDFYSDGCGPCRMIAPQFKALAEEYKDRAVFAKVDVNYNHQVASEQMIRSMPTFQMYLFGKKRDQFSGADINRLRSMLQELVRESKMKNVEVTLEAFKEYYKEVAPDKLGDDAKLQQLLDRNGKGGGPGHYALVNALKKKYGGTGPKTRPRAVESAAQQKPAAGGKSGGVGDKPSTTDCRSVAPSEPNLHLASVEALEEELRRRREEEEDRRFAASDDADDDDEEEEMCAFPLYNSTYAPPIENIAIIGAGPAGLAAAIYAARAGLRPVVVAPPIGGQLQGKGVLVENYPGVNDTTGPDIVYGMQLQAADFGTIFEQDAVTELDVRSRPFVLKTNQSTIHAHSIVVATGADSRWLGVPGEWDFRGGGVSSCATCDGYLFAERPVVVVGGGDTAMEDALVLARTSSAVTVVHRRSSFRASHVLAKRVLENKKITVLWNTEVVAFEGSRVRVLAGGVNVQLDADGAPVEEDLSGLRVKQLRERLDALGASYEGIKDKDELVRALRAAIGEALDASEGTAEEQTLLSRVRVRATPDADEPGAERTLDVAGAFIAIGHDPNTKFLRGQAEMDEAGYLITRPGTTRTSVEGLFAAGDVADKIYRQAVTSAGSGAAAALDAERWLSEQGHCGGCSPDAEGPKV